MLWKENTREVDSLGLARRVSLEMKKLSQELKEAKASNKDGGKLSDLKSAVRNAERHKKKLTIGWRKLLSRSRGS